MKSTKRAERRAQRDRMKEKAFWILRSMYSYSDGNNDDRARRDAGHFADNLKNCSCWMCGNPRKYFGEEKTRDMRQLEREKNEMREYFQKELPKLLDFRHFLRYDV